MKEIEKAFDEMHSYGEEICSSINNHHKELCDELKSINHDHNHKEIEKAFDEINDLFDLLK